MDRKAASGKKNPLALLRFRSPSQNVSVPVSVSQAVMEDLVIKLDESAKRSRHFSVLKDPARQTIGRNFPL